MDTRKRAAIFGMIAWATLIGSMACDDVFCPVGTRDVGGRCVRDEQADASTITSDASDETSSSSDGVRGTGSRADSGADAGASSAAAGTGNPPEAAGGNAAGAGPAAGDGNPAADGAGAANGGAGAAATGGAGAAAEGGATPSPGTQSATCGSEICDNQDNDCDGKVDEAVTRQCGPMMRGPCKPGTETCSAGMWSGECVGAVEPGIEECDAEGVDENCSGTSNENCACTSGTMQRCGMMGGICVWGVQTCNASGQWSTECVGAVFPGIEICDGVKDENCDGRIDEGCECTNGKPRECGVMAGVCKKGTNTCVDGTWSQICEGEIKPGIESCDTLDNDCDGKTDEGVQNACLGCARLANPPGASCSDGEYECRRTGQYECQGTEATKCNAVGRTPTAEVCDSVDNNCDGRNNEGLMNLCGGPCTATLSGTPDDRCQTAPIRDCSVGGTWMCRGSDVECVATCPYNCVDTQMQPNQDIIVSYNPCEYADTTFTCVPANVDNPGCEDWR